MKFQTKTIVSAADVSANINSSIMNMQNNYGYAIQTTLTGAPSGDVVVQGTNDENPTASSEWSEIEKTTIAGTTTIAFNKDAIYWPFVRVFKAAGGTGTMTVTITIKGA